MKRIYALCLLLTFPLMTACSLIPQEEVLPQMPIVQEIPDAVIETVEVLRGELKEERIFNCSYQPISEEKLYFSENGQAIAAIYVQAGDTVSAGDLIAELDNTQIQQKIDAQQQTLDSLNLQIVQEQNYIAVQKERIKVLQELAQTDPSYGSQLASAEASLQSRNSQVTYLYAQLSVEKSALSELEEVLKGRQLYATIDGTASYVFDLGDSTVYTKNQLICTLQDLSKASFVGTFREGMLTLGQQLTFLTSDSSVEVEVSQISPADEKGNCTVSFSLLTPDTSLRAGDGGRVTLVSNYLADTLYLPDSAVHKENGVSFVYYMDDNGLIGVKAIETGISINNCTQIISGLDEGELVLADAP